MRVTVLLEGKRNPTIRTTTTIRYVTCAGLFPPPHRSTYYDRPAEIETRLNVEPDAIASAGAERPRDGAATTIGWYRDDVEKAGRKHGAVEQDARGFVGRDRADEVRSPVEDGPQLHRLRALILCLENHGGLCLRGIDVAGLGV